MPTTDTILSQYSSDVAHQMNMYSSELFQKSPVFSSLANIGFGIFLLAIAKSVQKREFSSYVISFSIFIFFSLPTDNGIMFGRFANMIEKVIDITFGSIDRKVAEKFNDNFKLPPGYVQQVIDKAVNARIDNGLVKNMVQESVTNCIPSGKTYSKQDESGNIITGRDINAKDLFEVAVPPNSNAIIFKNFDSSILRNRRIDSWSLGGKNTDCYDMVTATIFSLRKRLKNQLAFEDVSSFSGNESIAKLVNELSTASVGSGQRQKVDAVALNVAQVNSIRSFIYKKNNPNMDQSSLNRYVGPEYSDQMRSSKLGGVYLSVASFIPSLKRAFNVDGMGDSISKLVDLNEKMNNVPYTIISIKNILWFCVPFVLMALALDLPSLFWVWLGGWVGITLYPHAMFYLRIHSNVITNSALMLSDPINLSQYSSNRLIQEVALTSVAQAMYDLSIAINQQLNTEYFVLGGFLTILPGMGFLANSKVQGGIFSKVGTFATQAVVGTTTRSAMNDVLNHSSSASAKEVELISSISGGVASNGIGATGIGSMVASSASGVSSELNNNKVDVYGFKDDVDPDPIVN